MPAGAPSRAHMPWITSGPVKWCLLPSISLSFLHALLGSQPQQPLLHLSRPLQFMGVSNGQATV